MLIHYRFSASGLSSLNSLAFCKPSKPLLLFCCSTGYLNSFFPLFFLGLAKVIQQGLSFKVTDLGHPSFQLQGMRTPSHLELPLYLFCTIEHFAQYQTISMCSQVIVILLRCMTLSFLRELFRGNQLTSYIHLESYIRNSFLFQVLVLSRYIPSKTVFKLRMSVIILEAPFVCSLNLLFLITEACHHSD